jgi:DNA end-binding protein Ku
VPDGSQPCGSATVPFCNGTCPLGERCGAEGIVPGLPCSCIPEAATACGESSTSTCTATCADGVDGTRVCAPFVVSSIDLCICVDADGECTPERAAHARALSPGRALRGHLGAVHALSRVSVGFTSISAQSLRDRRGGPPGTSNALCSAWRHVDGGERPRITMASHAPAEGGRSMWSGHLTFGLVSIPVGIHAATEASSRVAFRQLHRKDMAPIRYKKFCSEEDVEVPNDEIVKGYEVKKGEYAVVEKEELDKVQEEVGEGDHTIEIVEFVDFASLNPLLFEKPYYLAPQGGGAKPYALLQEALLESHRVGIARFYLRTRPLLAVVMPMKGIMALEVMRELDELRSPDHLEVSKGKASRGGAQDGALAHRVDVGHVGSDTASEHVPEGAREARRIEADVRARSPRGGREAAKVVDLMDALRKSLGQARKSGSRRHRAA